MNMDARTAIVNSLGCTFGKADWLIADLDASGFAVVPKEPTETMLSAAYGRERTGTERGNWKAMIEASKGTPADANYLSRWNAGMPYQTWKPFADDEIVEVVNIHGESRIGPAASFWWGYEQELGGTAEGVIVKARRVGGTAHKEGERAT